MRCRRQSAAFSLMEVVVALAVIVAGLTVILSLVPGLFRQSSEAESALAALNLAPAVTSKLTEIASGNVGNLPAQLTELGGDTSARLCLVAARDGTGLRLRPDSATPEDGQYFLIEPFQFTSAPLAYASGSGVLALSVRVSWPYRLVNGGQLLETPSTSRQSVTYAISLRP